MARVDLNYEDFCDLVPYKALTEVIYTDTEGRQIVVIRMLEMYAFYRELLQELP